MGRAGCWGRGRQEEWRNTSSTRLPRTTPGLGDTTRVGTQGPWENTRPHPPDGGTSETGEGVRVPSSTLWGPDPSSDKDPVRTPGVWTTWSLTSRFPPYSRPSGPPHVLLVPTPGSTPPPLLSADCPTSYTLTRPPPHKSHLGYRSHVSPRRVSTQTPSPTHPDVPVPGTLTRSDPSTCSLYL